MVGSRGLHAGCAEPLWPQQVSDNSTQQPHARHHFRNRRVVWSPSRNLWGGQTEGNSGSVVLPFEAWIRNPVPAAAPHQPVPGFAPRDVTGRANVDLDTGWGFAVACPHGKEKGKEPPTLGRGFGKAFADALAWGGGEKPGRAQGRAPGEVAGWERGDPPLS